MQIDITAFMLGTDTWPLSGSIATHGKNAGPSTWHAALDEAKDTVLLDTDDKRDAFRAFVKSSGGWTYEEIAAWSDQELNALLIQWISGDMREGGLDDVTLDEECEGEWLDYEERAEEGQCSSRIARGWSDASRLLYDAATAAGWFTYCGSWYYPTYLADSAYDACVVSGCLPPCDAIYFDLSD